MTQYNIYGDDTTFDGKISYILYFTLFEDTDITQRMRTLKHDFTCAYPDALLEDADYHVFQDLKTAKDFLHGGGLPFDCWRVLLCDTPVTMEKASAHRLQLLFTAFPEINIGKLTFNLQFKDTPTSEMVYLHHCNSNGAKLHFVNGDAFSIGEIYHKVLRTMQFYGKHGQTAHLIEINRFGNIDDVSEIMQNEKKRMYGIISGDEGWNHIPEELANERITADWSSRDYVEFITFGSNFLLLNLVDSLGAQNYRVNQKSFGGTYYGGMNPYFAMNAAIAGVNHGILFSVELVMAMKTIAHRILDFQASFQKSRTGNFREDIRRTKDYRRELIATLNRVENIDMTELGELEKVILTSQQITPIIDKIKYLLELLESELDLMYQTRTNHIANLIAVLGLILTLGSLVISWLGTFAV